MISSKKIAANRLNARSSTGPKTAAGKASASRNAHRHGLSMPVFADPILCRHVENLVVKIVAPHESPEGRRCARRIAEAQVDLNRIRLARDGALQAAYADANYASPLFDLTVSDFLWIAGNSNADIVPHKIVRAIEPSPEGDEKLLLVMSDLSKTLRGLDRYERRALSRRKLAIRERDAAQCLENRSRSSEGPVV